VKHIKELFIVLFVSFIIIQLTLLGFNYLGGTERALSDLVCRNMSYLFFYIPVDVLAGFESVSDGEQMTPGRIVVGLKLWACVAIVATGIAVTKRVILRLYP